MQRKVFDSGKQRSQNSDVPYKAIKKAAQEKEKVHFDALDLNDFFFCSMVVFFQDQKLIGEKDTKSLLELCRPQNKLNML